MRNVYVYFVFDKVSEMVLTAFTAVNSKIAKKSFDAMVAKNSIDSDDVALYRCVGFVVPDNLSDLDKCIAEELVEEVL